MINVSGFSTARYATWYYLDQYNLLFDAGDGVVANLGGKCEKVDHVFLSHADRDHLGAMIQFFQTSAASPKPPTYYYPKDSGSFPHLRDFLHAFDPHLPLCEWVPVEAGMRISVGKNLQVEIGENEHIAIANPATRGLVKSLDFRLIETRKKLKQEFTGLPGKDIAQLRQEQGEDRLVEYIERGVFAYSGDTPYLNVDRWRNTEVLAHEATFIAPDEGGRGHSELNEVIEAASRLDLKALIIGHFSARYDDAFIVSSVREAAERFGVGFPVHLMFPKKVRWDILKDEPVWE